MHQSDPKALLFIYRSFASLTVILSLASIVFPPVPTVAWINGLNTGELDVFFAFVTGLGDGVILVPFVILLLFRRIYMAVALAVAGSLQGMVVFLFKRIIFPSAERPVNFLDASVVHFVPGIEVHKMMSFPSGHTVTIFGLCVFLALCYRNHLLTICLLAVAAVVGLSRVYLLQHFMLDVAGGAVIGTCIAILAYQFFENTSRPSWMEQRLEILFRISGPRAGSLESKTVSFFSNRSLPR